jgi:hypothetical protein
MASLSIFAGIFDPQIDVKGKDRLVLQHVIHATNQQRGNLMVIHSSKNGIDVHFAILL